MLTPTPTRLLLLAASTLSTLVTSALAGSYARTEHIAGAGFYNAFEFQAIGDPTHGRVNYVDQATAQRANLTFASSSPDKFVLRADATTVLSDAGGVGRSSVRIRSRNTYTTHVAVFDVAHMPQGCGTWPAIWETDEASWPRGGEVDIVEGVNDDGANAVTLHTAPGCTMPAQRTETGTPGQLSCDTALNGNAGCGVRLASSSPASYGPAFNAAGGGWYALERTDSFINVWFWPRNGAVPADVRAGGGSVDTAGWGVPAANFPNTSCDIPRFFSAHNIIINLTFCGDWAGQQGLYAGAGCPSTCITDDRTGYVDANPAAFRNAYFEFNAINIYK
ncbi:glycoside hydrolase family 16 protein [Mycena belliarum]|uniref:Glycoside hydrolase family 16 protein n=1 Tax=Mycena belliarum TaxID=1033014 RepID=A0AAD6UAN0_9AGAR|nr:glycoside hydrolase family 16 protein [Mycena belliae]